MATDWEGILKFQRSLHTTERAERCLIYNESRSIMVEEEMQPGVKKWFANDEPKFYAEVEIADGHMKIKQKVKAQPW